MAHRISLGLVVVTLWASGASMGSAQESALDGLRAAARANARDGAAQSALGRALLRAGHYRQAERTLRTAARLQGNSPEAHYRVAEVAFARLDYRAARSACRPIERDSRNSTLARVCRARAFLVWNRSGRAFEELEAALAADGANFDALFALGEAHRLRAAVSDAEAAYNRAIAVDATRPEPHHGLGRLYSAANRRDDSVAALRRAIALDTDDPAIQYDLGRILAGQEGLVLLRAAATNRPEWDDGQLALAEAALAAGENAEARTAYTRAIALDARLAPAHTGLGRVLSAAGEHEAAEAAFMQSLELVANSAVTVVELGRLYETMGRNQDAFDQYSHAHDLDPRNPQGLLAAAALALRRGRDVLASGYLDRLMRRHPNLAAALALYGDVMAARSNRTGARDYYERALAGEGEVDRARVQEAMRTLDQPRQQRRQIQRATVPDR